MKTTESKSVPVPDEVIDCTMNAIFEEYGLKCSLSQARVLGLVGYLNETCKQKSRSMKEAIMALEMEKRFLQAYIVVNPHVE